MGTTFLKQSVMLAFGETSFDFANVAEGGIWISRILSSHQNRWYRMSINTVHGKHYSLLLVLQDNLKASRVLESVYWLLAISGYPFDSPVLPRLGCFRPELGARSIAYIGELTAWTKIRQLSLTPMEDDEAEASEWRKLYVRAASAFFRGWANSGYRIVPGSVSPTNVVVPEADFRENVRILSLTGWIKYKRPLDLITPMLRNFYRKSIANYPACREHLHIHWIFDACVESLGKDKAMEFLENLQADLKKEPVINFTGNPLTDTVANYIQRMHTTYFVPLPLRIAINRYRDWEQLGPTTSKPARESMVVELYNLYRIARFEETARYYLYRHTFFKDAKKSVLNIFDRLIDRLSASPDTAAVQTAELSDLQSALTDEADRDVFSRLVFPTIGDPQKVEVVKVGEGAQKQVIVQSEISDRYGETYTFREPVEPVEIGRLYRLFFEENYPLSISEQHRHFIAMDAQERIVGGIAYVLMENDIARIDGIVVTTTLKERGIGSALLADFENRMLSQSIDVLKTLFYHPQFFIKHGFKVDERWGALVKIVSVDPNSVQHSSEKTI